MRWLAAGVLALSPELWASMVVASPFAYVSNAGSGTVSVIDTATNIVVATCPRQYPSRHCPSGG